MIVCSNDDPGVSLTYFKAKLVTEAFSMGKWENSGYLRNYSSQWPKICRCKQLIQ